MRARPTPKTKLVSVNKLPVGAQFWDPEFSTSPLQVVFTKPSTGSDGLPADYHRVQAREVFPTGTTKTGVRSYNRPRNFKVAALV